MPKRPRLTSARCRTEAIPVPSDGSAASGGDPGPHALSAIGGNSKIEYDAVGNIRKLDGMILSWNAANQLIAVDSDQTHYEYSYDVSGNRLLKRSWKVTAGSSFQRPPDAWTVYLNRDFEVSRDGTRTHIWAGEDLLATAVPGRSPAVYWLHADLLGSTVLTTDLGGKPITEFSYYPFGAIRSQIGQVADLAAQGSYWFTGKERDIESGLDYFGARFYASSVARFISPDAGEVKLEHFENPQKWNKYTYALNNPLSMIDPDGREENSMLFQSSSYRRRTMVPFRGDNRAFSSDSAASSRVSVTMKIETDPVKNEGHPLIGSPQVTVGLNPPKHFWW